MSFELFDYRYDPFNQTFSSFGYGYSGNPKEVHIIPSSAPYYVYLNEIPRSDSPSTLLVNEQGGSSFTEVSQSTSPAAGQFRAIYGGDETQPISIVGQGTLEFNSADAGKIMEISYYGMGSIVQKQLFNNVLIKTEIFESGSGIWIKPENVSRIDIFMAGGGGGGGGGGGNDTGGGNERGGGGGGGGEGQIRIQKNFPVSSDLSYSIGAKGVGGIYGNDGTPGTKGTDGTNGGVTTFGALIANGGNKGIGGNGGAAGTPGVGGAGGAPQLTGASGGSIGEDGQMGISNKGGDGGDGQILILGQGGGGAGFGGGRGNGGAAQKDGEDATYYGSGGGGGGAKSSTPNGGSGGDGFGGKIIITYQVDIA